MKALAIYEANDGERFDVSADCERHEQRCAEVALILAPLGKRHTACEYQNGHGYVQHGLARFKACEAALYEHAERHGSCHRDAGAPWSQAFYRFHCVDNGGREWGQPFFAINEGEGEFFEIKPEGSQ